MNAKNVLSLISKQWCNLEDLKNLTGLGKTNCIKLKNKIRTNLLDKGYDLPNKLLPMNEVVEYLKSDINYLKKVIEKTNNEKGESIENDK